MELQVQTFIIIIAHIKFTIVLSCHVIIATVLFVAQGAVFKWSKAKQKVSENHKQAGIFKNFYVKLEILLWDCL